MAKKKRSWREKLADDKDLPKVFAIEPKHQARFGTGKMVVPAPREVDALMRKVPLGKVVTSTELTAALATKHHADVACPLTTGIFSCMAANAASEAEEAGASKITPYWRTLKAGGELNPKFPGGIDAQKIRLEAEGHAVVCKGKRYFVADYGKKLIKELK